MFFVDVLRLLHQNPRLNGAGGAPTPPIRVFDMLLLQTKTGNLKKNQGRPPVERRSYIQIGRLVES
jgi:hypothetical protein